MYTTPKQNKSQYLNGFDYDGTSDHIPLLPDSVIITGRSKKDEKLVRKIVGDIPIFFFPNDLEHTDENVGKFKGETVKKLGLKLFFDDNEVQHDIIQEMNPDIKVVHVKQDGKKFVTISQGWDGMPIAHHLLLEGENSIIGQIQDKKELGLGDDKEDPEDKEQRLKQYDGLIKKYPARKIIDALKKVKNKDDYFIFFDQNNLFKYAEELLKAGFKNGLFPTKEDHEMEKDRELAMQFVEENYPQVQIIPHQEVKTIEEAKQLIEESDKPMVLQSAGDFVPTICPVDDVEANHAELVSALEKYEKDYQKGGIILKEKLVQPIEITPQIVFWNGEVCFTDIDIETKNIGTGENNGNQVGCGTNLIISTDLEEEINKIAFPPKVYEMAKQRKGIFVWDISLYFTKDGIYFGEFCSNRFGYDALMTEMCMSGGAGKYFTALMNSENPLKAKFGAALRTFNLNRQKDMEIKLFNEEYVWLYEVTKKDNKRISLGDCWDLGVVTAEGNTPNEAIEKLYENYNDLSFKEKYARVKSDFLGMYPTSIALRYSMINHALIEAPDFEEYKEQADLESSKLDMVRSQEKKRFDDRLSEMEKEQKSNIIAIRKEITSILND